MGIAMDVDTLAVSGCARAWAAAEWHALSGARDGKGRRCAWVCVRTYMSVTTIFFNFLNSEQTFTYSNIYYHPNIMQSMIQNIKPCSSP
jgi:hypothetical protein